MNSAQIKIVAVLSMLIDHLGVFFFPELTLMRYIGRIAFPLFAWLIANGAYYTNNIQKYLVRLFILASVSQIPFIVALKENDFLTHLNVVFTLFFGLLAIMSIKKINNKLFQTISVLICAFFANFLHSDYGSLGVLSIVFFYIFFHNKKLITVSQSIIFLLLPFVSYIIKELSSLELSPAYMGSSYEKFALMSLPFIFLYNKKEGKLFGGKKTLYFFFPLHFVCIIIIQILLK